jgi:predicted methyltransferase
MRPPLDRGARFAGRQAARSQLNCEPPVASGLEDAAGWARALVACPMHRSPLMRSSSRTVGRQRLCGLLGAAWPLFVHCAPVEVVPPPRAADAIAAPEEAPSVRPSPAAAAKPTAHEAEPTRSLMEFIGAGRGERVADLGSGAGYSLSSLSDAVGPSGVVYARHDPRLLVGPARPGAPTEREGTLPDNIVVMTTPLSAPFSAAARDLDRVTLLFAYEDLVASGRDRLAFNRAVFGALAPEGLYVIAGHGAAAGAGVDAARAGRVDEELVRTEVEAAGFFFVEGAQLLPSTAPAGSATSQYVLEFRRPK